jgi:alkyl sulfatase BDS1-like metallo-beta-lactamase superfamily hydrolase
MATQEPLSAAKDKLRKDQGEAYQRALDYMAVETASAQVEADDYIITLACEEAEGMYHVMENGELEWRVPPAEENQHVEVAVQSKLDKRFMGGLDITCKLFDSDGKLIGEKVQPYIWHPFLDHYGVNWVIPGEGDYTAEVTIKRPTFCRHDEFIGKLFQNDVTVKLGPVHLVPDRSEHGGE